MEKQTEPSSVYEVFVQRDHLDPMIHVGSLLAPTSELALQLARENFTRREQVLQIWVVPRIHIQSAEEADFHAREMDRSYREVSGYTENGRLWRMFKEKEITLEEIVRYVEQKKQSKNDLHREEGHES
ncbi:ring-1,2-phenylacetyl-CoA epoxidase subunit PaaB [Croceifilum oryzae]|uniref:Ring-1,2-phenylacetyl-CoA epoxidase subunit PaaB n=1 Tax=Croceifilum oryzae TaxID=1553429 RepID=A0AAJ1TL57_9BACL|nr:phenylacetic acid degradation protein [Croceifilum oryzae]MDQ0416640.1 ring-1,2-phenylacetyl-CoA epoxidase subunit PaaB [Croceifilum oryzae]